MVLVYLPTKLGDFVRANVGIHIPAPWFAYGYRVVHPGERKSIGPNKEQRMSQPEWGVETQYFYQPFNRYWVLPH